MKIYLSLFLAVFALGACNKSENEEPGNLAASNTMNVAYGTDAAQKMDIYLPAGRTASGTKLLILVHGGGWTGGDKSEFDPYITQLQQRFPDYAIFNVNYRLANNTTNKFPSQENDLKAATEFILERTGDYKISRDVVFLGFSAGAHLALLQGYKHISVVKPRAIVSFFGPSDLVEMHNNPVNPYAPMLLEALLGFTPQQNLNAYQQSSPAFFVNASSAPTMILHGGQDNIVSPTQANILKDKLSAAGVAHQFVYYPNEGHGWFGATLEDSFNKIEAFLDTYVR